jgi:hypothetical protein
MRSRHRAGALRARCRSVLRPVGIAAVVLVACIAALAPATAGAATGGSISGTVTAADTKVPLEGVEACATAHETKSAPKCATSDAEGKYSITELTADQYDVKFELAEGSPLNYQVQYYNGKSKPEEAEPVTVAEEANTPLIDAALAPGGGELQGRVTEEKGEPISAIEVCAVLVSDETQERCTQTGAEGTYTITGLASGNYTIKFSEPFESPLEYAQQFYKNVAKRVLATPVPVAAGGPASTGVDAVLAAGGVIEGTVSSAATKAPLEGVHVCASSAAIENALCASTDAAGHYALKRLVAGSYKLLFVPGEGSGGYLEQFFDGKPLEAEADPIEVLAGATVTGVDAALAEPPAEEPEEVPTEGRPVAVLKPAIVGTAVEGQTLTMLHGTWSNSPTQITDEWGQCDGSGAITSCHTVATTPTYTLTAADVGHTIRIREKAANALGEGTPLFSPPSAVVVVKPAPAAVTGVLAAIAKSATTAQLKALLARLLLPHGSKAKIAALLKHRGYAVSFSSIAAGRLSVSWYQVPKGAHLSDRAKPVLVASGKVTTKESGVAKLTIKLTAKGRKLIAAAKQPLKLTAKGVLAPRGASSLRATHAFAVKR